MSVCCLFPYSSKAVRVRVRKEVNLGEETTDPGAPMMM